MIHQSQPLFSLLLDDLPAYESEAAAKAAVGAERLVLAAKWLAGVVE